jgi:hypothetical protein
MPVSGALFYKPGELCVDFRPTAVEGGMTYCSLHPYYQAKREPKTECWVCRHIWRDREEIKTEVARIGKPRKKGVTT